MVSGDIDILIGTQMITKGHDFPNVTLVGVVLADLSLNVPDFRSAERSFQLLTQVAGRAGRGGVPGQVVIQTHHPEHYVFEYVRDHDYENFFSAEMRYRNRLNYPPNTRLAALVLESSQERSGEAAMKRLKRALAGIVGRRPGLELLGPSRAALYRIKNKYRWHLILRAREVRTLQSVLKQVRDLPEWKQVRNFKLIIDVDPVNML